MPLQLKNSNATITLQAPITQVGGGAVDSVNGMTGDVVLDIPSKTSQLQNDSDFATNSALKTEIAAVEGKIPAHVVKYTPQTLNDGQKKQARENIGAEAVNGGLVATNMTNPINGRVVTTYTTHESCKLLPYDAADADNKFKYFRVYAMCIGAINPINAAYAKESVEFVKDIWNKKYFTGDVFAAYKDSLKSTVFSINHGTYQGKSLLQVNYDNGYASFSAEINTETGEFDTVYCSYSRKVLVSTTNFENEATLPQQTMASAPTTAKQIATKEYVDDGLAKKAPAGDYATKAELAAKQDTLTAGNNITIADGVISASSGSGIKSIRFRTGKIDEEETSAQFKEWLTYLWNIGNGSYVDLSKCIVTIDGQVMDSVYCQNIGASQYIYFYPAVLSNFDNNDKLARYYYMCDYSIAMTKAQDYSYINKSQYATTILTSDNYTQYISTGGNYTTDASDSNLYNAVELYICIYSGSNYAFLYIKPEQNLTFSSCTYQNYAYAINNAVHSLYYDGNNLVINDGVDDTIKFIWYK